MHPGAKIATLEEVLDLVDCYGDKRVEINLEVNLCSTTGSIISSNQTRRLNWIRFAPMRPWLSTTTSTILFLFSRSVGMPVELISSLSTGAPSSVSKRNFRRPGPWRSWTPTMLNLKTVVSRGILGWAELTYDLLLTLFWRVGGCN